MSPKIPVTAKEYGRLLARSRNLKGCLSQNPPRNLEEIQMSLNRPRNTDPMTEQDQTSFDKLIDKAQTSNEAFFISAILPKFLDLSDLYEDSDFEFSVQLRWTNQRIMSHELKQPLPDFTLGIQYDTKCSQYPHTFSDNQNYSEQLRPAPEMVCPLLTLEAKGWQGPLGEAELQNRHNGMCMLSNLFDLKNAAGIQVRSYRNRIQALTIEATPESFQVSGHWMDEEGYFRSAHIERSMSSDLERAQQLANNAVDWAKGELRALDTALFGKLEAKATKSRKRKRSESP